MHQREMEILAKFMFDEQTLIDSPLHKLGIFMPPSRQPIKKHIFEP